MRAAAVTAGLLAGGLHATLQAQATRSQVTDAAGDVYPTKPKPLLSLDSLHFLEGTWTAKSTGEHGGAPLGAYAFVRQLNGHVLARQSTTDPGCKAPAVSACTHQDQMSIFQESPGAPLKAIYFDSEGHILHYGVEIRHEGGAYNQRDVAIFLSEAAGLGPRFRLSYERNTDTQTGANSMSGRFETMLANGEWLTNLQWVGIAQRTAP